MNKSCFKKWHHCLAMILIFLVSTSTRGQGYDTTKWKFSNPQQFGFTVQDVHYLDNNNVIAVGSDGGIAKSTDAGRNWTYGVFTYTNAAGMLAKPSFSDVHYVSATTAYAVGTGGTMAKTTDGGLTWTFVTTPFFGSGRNINAVWFVNENKGYFGGQYNTPDSLPKLYVTNNGGATWDSMAAPISNGTTKVGFVNNATYPALDYPIDAKAKEIQRIIFLNNSIGYISGGGTSTFPTLNVPNITNTTTCAFTGLQTTGSHNASLLWKFDNGTLTDYSISKERLGYTGNPAAPLNCSSKFGTVTSTTQQFRALNIINDSLIVMMSFNNNIVIRVRTGRNDSTQNINRPGVYEKGRYEILNTGFAGPPPGYPPVPAVQVLNASNPYQMKRTSNGTLLVNGNFARLFTSVDTGRNWVESRSLPPGQNYSTNGVWALDIAPNGRVLSMGALGVVADSLPGGAWFSNYKTVPFSSSFTKMEFADCNNGVTTGSANINVTTDGGKTWYDRTRPDFAASFYSINGFAYRNSNPSRAYFAVTNGTIYYSPDLNVVPPATPTLDPVYADGLMQMHDVATVGNDSVWAVGFSSSSVPAASRTPKIYRSINAGANWSVYSGFPVGSLAPTLTDIEFPTNMVGYAAGTRDTIYKTTDAGATWTKLPLPTPGVTPQITYKDMIALDANTVFLVGNGFPRKVVFKTTDGGATWTDITNNILTLGVGNLNGIVMQDVNNGYVMTPGLMCKTTNGGATWTLEVPPTGCIFETGAFAPKTVPASVPFANRRLFVTGSNISGAPIMEFGSSVTTKVNSTETVVNASCTNLTAGSITINATGAIAPYTYSIDGTTFQSSNIFTGLTQGPKTITIKDSYCGILIKTINVGFTDNLTLTTNNDTLVCAGAPVQMTATSAATTYAWTPSAGLSNSAISNPVATVNSTSAFTVTASLNGCVKTKTVTVNIKPNPAISAGPDKTIYIGDAVTLQGSGAANTASIAWTPNNTITGGANTYTPVAKPTATTTYTLTVKDNSNCTSTDNVLVTVVPNCMKVMTAFSPNGDGQNDKWIVTNNGGNCTNQVYVAVYNRYGGLVYKNDNYTNNWDGTYNGKPVADGTYYYAITYRLINGGSVKVQGDVTIFR